MEHTHGKKRYKDFDKIVQNFNSLNIYNGAIFTKKYQLTSDLLRTIETIQNIKFDFLLNESYSPDDDRKVEAS